MGSIPASPTAERQIPRYLVAARPTDVKLESKGSLPPGLQTRSVSNGCPAMSGRERDTLEGFDFPSSPRVRSCKSEPWRRTTNDRRSGVTRGPMNKGGSLAAKSFHSMESAGSNPVHLLDNFILGRVSALHRFYPPDGDPGCSRRRDGEVSGAGGFESPHVHGGIGGNPSPPREANWLSGC